VSLRDLLSLRAEADLVVLSACETGIPQLDVPDEVISLATGMLQARARCVVSSLWAVNDLSTALLMDRFYRELGGALAGEPKPVAIALHAAQEWLRNLTLAEVRGILVQWMATTTAEDLQNVLIVHFMALGQRGEHPFAHPHYWAGFQAHGAAF
jgi:CHAT domain-containing protein